MSNYKDKDKDKDSAAEHLVRLANAILYGGNFSIHKTHWCEEHKCYEY